MLRLAVRYATGTATASLPCRSGSNGLACAGHGLLYLLMILIPPAAG